MSWLLVACGNKGDLFLPPDAQLADELDAAVISSEIPSPESADAIEDTDERKRKHKSDE